MDEYYDEEERELPTRSQEVDINNLINTSGNLISKFLDTYEECQRVKLNMAKINAATDVALAQISAKFMLGQQIIEKVFGEREKSLSKSYQVLDHALENNDRELIVASLKSISEVVTKNPISDFGSFIEIINDKDKPLELDF